jgi:predicted AlkP superfamily pyrophosphatase or phosphodiesterase
MARHLLGVVTRGIVLLHLFEYDTVQHNSGPGSEAAIATLERTDRYIAELVKTIEEQDERQETVIAIVSDHGFRTYEKVLNPNTALKEEGLIATNTAGTITDWQAYYHSSGGGGFVYLKQPGDAALKTRVGSLLSKLKEDSQNGIDVLWTREELDRLGAHPGASFGMAMADGFYSGQATTGLRRSSGKRGGHGYDPAAREMHAALIIAGSAVPRRGDVGIVRMTQIAPTLAGLLGLRLAPEADKPIW